MGYRGPKKGEGGRPPGTFGKAMRVSIPIKLVPMVADLIKTMQAKGELPEGYEIYTEVKYRKTSGQKVKSSRYKGFQQKQQQIKKA